MKLKTLILSLALATSLMAALAEGVYTRQCDDKANADMCEAWMESGAWRNGFEKAAPHESVNAVVRELTGRASLPKTYGCHPKRIATVVLFYGFKSLNM